MRWPLITVFGVLLAHSVASADSKPMVRDLKGLLVMTPSPTQSPPPGLRMRTMVRPADRLWIGVDPPAHVPLALGDSRLDLLDPTPSGGFVATYRQLNGACSANCTVTVKVFDKSKTELASVSLDEHFSRRDNLEVQDVRYVEADRALYFNEACQSYSKEAGGKCSSLVALDPFGKKVLWRTAPLTSNNEFVVSGPYLVTAYGFTGEPASIRVVRRTDGKVMDKQPLAHSNFEMTTSGDVLSVELYYTYGRANFRMVGFSGDAPKLAALPMTPPDPNDKPKPYNPALLTTTKSPF